MEYSEHTKLVASNETTVSHFNILDWTLTYSIYQTWKH